MKKSSKLVLWKNLLFVFMPSLFCFFASNSFSQNGENGNIYGVWQNRASVVDKFSNPNYVADSSIINGKTWK